MITAGSKVVMNGKYKIPKSDKGKVFVVRSEPYDICGTNVVLLEGKTVDGLTEVKRRKKGITQMVN